MFCRCPTLLWSTCLLILPVFLAMCAKHTENKTFVVEEEWHQLLAKPDSINEAFGGYYVALPPRYDQRIDSFPLLLFLHGLGQLGNGNSELPYVLFDGIGKLINEKKFPASFTSHSRLYSFIVVSPQSSRQPTAQEVIQLKELLLERYRIDRSRVYLSGLSMGARVVTITAGEYPQDFAAIVPIAGVATGAGGPERCRRIAEAGLPVWELHNADDPMAPVGEASRFISMLLESQPAVKPRFTIFDVYGHDAWTTALNPAYRENGMNIYEWMLKFAR